MRVDTESGLLQGVPYVSSPHADERPPGVVIELVVIHGISLPPGELGGPWIEQLFLGRLPADGHPYFATIQELRVSAHLLIRRDGATIQYVPFSRRAWHAGVSSWQDRARVNDYSIGIELEGTDDRPYESAQYHSLGAVGRGLIAAYPALDPQRFVGHSDVAPGRKTDPGPCFDWSRLHRLLASEQPAAARR